MPLPAKNESDFLHWYERIYMCRACEERIRIEYLRDEMKTPVHLSIGAEAIAVGVIGTAPPTSPIFATYRNHAVYLSRTDDIDGFFGELYGRQTGRCRGRAGSMHLTYPAMGVILSSAIVGSTIPVAVGMALARHSQGISAPVITFFGDGAMEEGVFWESLNFACLKSLPVIFVCEDNRLAIHAHAEDRKGHDSMTRPVEAFRCHTASVEGSDVRAVAQTTKHMLDRMLARPAPGFLHFTYHRFLEHVGINEDYLAGYRPPPSEDQKRAWDPLCIIENAAAAEGVQAGVLQAARAAIDERIDAAVRSALLAPPPGADDLRSNPDS